MKNEVRPIDANKLNVCYVNTGTVMFPKIEAFVRADDIADAPILNAVEVVHGRWNPYKISNAFTHSCSVCHCDVNEKTPYCPYCGAKMDGGNENG